MVTFTNEDPLENNLPRLMSQMHLETLDSAAGSPRKSSITDDMEGENDEDPLKDVKGSSKTKKAKKPKFGRSKSTEKDTDPKIPHDDDGMASNSGENVLDDCETAKRKELSKTIPSNINIANGENEFQNHPQEEHSCHLPLKQINDQDNQTVEESFIETRGNGIEGHESVNEITRQESGTSLKYVSSVGPRPSSHNERLKSFIQQSMQDRFSTLKVVPTQVKSPFFGKKPDKDYSHLFRTPSILPLSSDSRSLSLDFRSQSRISRLPNFSSLSVADPSCIIQAQAPQCYDDLFVSSASSMTMKILKKENEKNQSQCSVTEKSSKSTVAHQVSSHLYSSSLGSRVSGFQKSQKSVGNRAADRSDPEKPQGTVEILNLDEVMNRIVDDDEYDLMVTYKLPKSAPFDPEDKLKDVRIKCIENWMNDRGNALYKSIFEDEIELSVERKSIEKLIDKLVDSMRKIKKCHACQKPPSTSVQSVVASSSSTFSLVENLSLGVLDDGISEKSSSRASILDEHEEDLFAALKEEVILLSNEMENMLKHKASQDLRSRGNSNTGNDSEMGGTIDLDVEDIEHSSDDKPIKRMRSVRCQLERIIGILEAKIEENNETFDLEQGEDCQSLITVASRWRVCKCVDPWLDGLADNLKSHFNTHTTAGIPQTELTCIDLTERSARKTRDIEITEPKETDDVQRVQMYLLGLTNSWLPEGLTEMAQLESSSSDVNKENQSFTLGKDQSPIFCKCGCDRVSRFNVKQKQHFRPVVDENLECYYNGSNAVHESLGGLSKNGDGPMKISNTKWGRKRPDKFKGWLADTDRNLLLMMNRSLGDRPAINKNTSVENYGKNTLLTNEYLDDKRSSRAEIIRDVLTDVGETEAEKFWDFVGETYANYRKNDKSRRLIDEFEKVDHLSMLKRDLDLLKEQMNRQLDEAKESVRQKIEQQQQLKFEKAVQKLQESLECQSEQRLAATKIELDRRKIFQIHRLKLEADVRFKLKFREFKRACVEILKWKTDPRRAHPMIKALREANEIVTTAGQIDIGERLRSTILGNIGLEHEELEKALGEAIKTRNQTIDNLKGNIIKLNRDVVIWKSAVSEVLTSHRKFVQYVLETRPDRAQYALNLERIYQLKMDGLIEIFAQGTTHTEYDDLALKLKISYLFIDTIDYTSNQDVQNELKTKLKERNEAESREKEKLLQPAFEIKCPSHVIRYSSGTASAIGSSSDTDVEQDVRARKIARHAVDYAIRAALPPSMEPSDMGEASEMKEQDAIGFRSSESPPSLLEKEAEPVVSNVCYEPTSAPQTMTVIVGDDASRTSIHLDEFTRRRVQEMLGVISRKTPQIKTQVQL